MAATIIKEKALKQSLEESLEKLQIETPIYSKSTKNARSVDLFMGEEPELDGIEVFMGGTTDDEDELGEDEE